MAYDDREKSRYGAQPIEGFRFVQGDDVWLYTSADREITFPIGTFTPETITRGEVRQTKEDTGETLSLRLPVANPVAELFIAESPSTPVWFTHYRAHRGDETEAIAIFSGKIVRAAFEETEVELTATSIAAALTRGFPPLQMQTPCNHVLFSAGCGANPTSCRDAVTITTVSGRTVTSNDFALRADGWFSAGKLQAPDGETRFIADHVGDTITLLSPMPGLESLDECWAYWGCSHRAASCLDKFNNLINHLGWSHIPGKNVFRSRLDTPWDSRHLWG